MFIPPMLLEKSNEPFNDPEFIFEPKIDGHRLIMSFNNKETRLFTRQDEAKLLNRSHRHGMTPLDRL
jgi:DNA ligase 1